MVKITKLGLLLFFYVFSLPVSHSFDDLSYTRHRRQANDMKCTLPPYPEHGKWRLLKGEAKPGEKILKSSLIIYECNHGHQLSSDIPYRICDKKWRSLKFPQCEELCPPLFSSNIYDLTCRHKSGNEIKCNEATDGSFVEYNCVRFYEIPPEDSNIVQCKDGKWNQKPVCQPVCGRKIKDTKPEILGTKFNEEIQYPWVAALYVKIEGSYTYNCGGTILSPTIVLTAAYCVTNGKGDILPKENYLIGAGKLYRTYKNSEDEDSQYLEISNIIVQDLYRADYQHNKADIAVLVMKGEFVLNEVTQPICFNNIKKIPLHPGKSGEVSGWVMTGEEQSEKLRTITIPFKYDSTCALEIPPDWANKYYMKDKICAGFHDQNMTICDGDRGSGLAFKNRDGKYYIHGIVSIAHQFEGTCDIQQNALFTKTAQYFDFIHDLLIKYAPIIKDCKLPPYPENGKWIIKGQDKKPGDAVTASTILKVKCDERFISTSASLYVTCGASHNLPTCQKTCSEIRFPEGTVYQCVNKERNVINCTQAVDGTLLAYACPKGYQALSNNHLCKNGEWVFPLPACILTKSLNCGKTSVEHKYPWSVGLYKFDNNVEGKYKYFCGGTLISYNFVLTAAHCVTNESAVIMPYDNYMVVAGKNYVKFNDSRDDEAQYLKISKIIIHQFYTGKKIFFLADVAILILESTFIPKSSVEPACVDIHEQFVLSPNATKGVVQRYKNDSNEIDGIEVTHIKIGDCDITHNDLDWGKNCGRISSKSDCLSPDDSGKGFVSPNSINKLHYVVGIINANTIVDGNCQLNILYTQVGWYLDFINYETRNQLWLASFP